MATETLNPNGDGTTNQFSLSTGSDRSALVTDGDDATYVAGGNVDGAQWWTIVIDGTTIYDNDGSSYEPSSNNNSATITDFTRAINSTNFSGCPTITKALITSLEIGMKSGAGPSVKTQLFNIDNPTFSDDATINSVTINGRLSWVVHDTWIHEISLVVDYTAVISPTLLKLKSGTLTLKGGTLTIK